MGSDSQKKLGTGRMLDARKKGYVVSIRRVFNYMGLDTVQGG